MPRNLPVSNKQDTKENSCVSFGAGWFTIIVIVKGAFNLVPSWVKVMFSRITRTNDVF